jgi:hypothetical protein
MRRQGTTLGLAGLLCLFIAGGAFSVVASASQRRTSSAVVNRQPSSVRRPGGGSIEGTVVDPNGRPVAGATVCLRRLSTSDTTTDSNATGCG